MKDYVNIQTRPQARTNTKKVALEIIDALIGLGILGLIGLMVSGIFVMIH